MFKKKPQKRMDDIWSAEEVWTPPAPGAGNDWLQEDEAFGNPFEEPAEQTPRKKSSGPNRSRLVFPLAVVAVILGLALTRLPKKHAHIWADADCRSPKICLECGETEGAALGHNWQKASLNMPETCFRCGETRGETLSDGVFSEADRYLLEGKYRQAIQLMDEAYRQYGDRQFLDLASDYRLALSNYHSARVAAGKHNTLMVYPDGSVAIVGENKFGELEAASWQSMASVCAGDEFVLGLRKNGTVVGAGRNKYREYGNVESWRNVLAISAGDFHAVGLLADGTIVSAPGYNHCGAADVEQLNVAAGDRRIVAVSAGYDHTLVLLEDGTVLACGDRPTSENKENGVCQVQHWREIAAICSGTEFCAGLKTDGTVVVAGVYWDLHHWTDVHSLSAGDFFLVGLKDDGTVLLQIQENEYKSDQVQALSLVREWTDMVYIAAGHDHIIGIRADGKVLCVGLKTEGQCALQGSMVPMQG